MALYSGSKQQIQKYILEQQNAKISIAFGKTTPTTAKQYLQKYNGYFGLFVFNIKLDSVYQNTSQKEFSRMKQRRKNELYVSMRPQEIWSMKQQVLLCQVWSTDLSPCCSAANPTSSRCQASLDVKEVITHVLWLLSPIGVLTRGKSCFLCSSFLLSLCLINKQTNLVYGVNICKDNNLGVSIDLSILQFSEDRVQTAYRKRNPYFNINVVKLPNTRVTQNI